MKRLNEFLKVKAEKEFKDNEWVTISLNELEEKGLLEDMEDLYIKNFENIHKNFRFYCPESGEYIDSVLDDDLSDDTEIYCTECNEYHNVEDCDCEVEFIINKEFIESVS